VSTYLDHAATTPMNPVAITAMTAALSKIGNPSSLHTDGRSTRKDVEDARDVIARSLGCAPSEVIFTGSGTEANNIAIKGLYWLRNQDAKRSYIVVSAIEHQAVLEPAEWLAEHEGAQVIRIPVSPFGVLDQHTLTRVIAEYGDQIALISVMHSNNETGVLQPIEDVVKLAADIPVHSDAIQSWQKAPLDFSALGLFALSVSGHKVGGPIGVGALVLKRGVDIPALIHGGGQEREIRSGTVNAPSIVALAAAIENSNYNAAAVQEIREYFEQALRMYVPDAVINGAEVDRLPGISNITIPDTLNETMLLLLDGEKISCSTGAACSAGVHRPSHVLEAMGLDEKAVMSSLRFSFGATSTEDDVEAVIPVLPPVIERARAAAQA
jgi:cysteine desulfurase